MRRRPRCWRRCGTRRCRAACARCTPRTWTSTATRSAEATRHCLSMSNSTASRLTEFSVKGHSHAITRMGQRVLLNKRLAECICCIASFMGISMCRMDAIAPAYAGVHRISVHRVMKQTALVSCDHFLGRAAGVHIREPVRGGEDAGPGRVLARQAGAGHGRAAPGRAQAAAAPAAARVAAAPAEVCELKR